MPQPDDPLDEAAAEAMGNRLRQALKSLPDAPLAMQRSAIGLWPGVAPVWQAAAGAVLRRVAAALSFDSWAVPALAGGQRSLRSPTRQLLFSAQGRDVDLRIAPAGDGFSLAGQVLGPDDSGNVELQRLDVGGAAARRAPLDALGEFRIEGLGAGLYSLSLQLGGDEVLLPPFDVGGVAAVPG
jgi:hypothetical protein